MSSNNGGGGTAEGLAFLIVIAGLIYFENTRTFGFILLGLLVAFLAIIMTWAVSSENKAQAKRSELLARAEQKVSGIVGRHLDTLANRRDTLVRVDRYGVVDGGDWNKEVQHFIDKVVRPELTDDESQAIAEAGISSFFQRLVENRVADHCETRETTSAVPIGTSPLDFEGMCAALLRQYGWDASTTKGSGDQGADVIAEYKGKKLVLQCKLYSGNVGNKAVQEVIAAKHFYKADFAAVVCKSEFSKSARQLAQSAGVEILTYSELGDFAERLTQLENGPSPASATK